MSKTQKPRAYAYVRMSTEAQSKGDSLQRQIGLANEYAQQHGLELDKELELHDIGLSAYDGSNLAKGALGKFMQFVKDGVIAKGSYLLVESLDRLSREDLRSSIPLLLEFQNHGINIVTTTDRRVFAPDNDAFMDMMHGLMIFSRANEESVQKSRRLKSAWESKRKNISTQKLTARCPAWLRLAGSKDSFEVIPEREEIVKRIFGESLSGIGADAIARRLNKEGIKPFRSSNGWQKSSVQKILKSRAVIGEFQPMTITNKQRSNTGDVHENYFPSIIDKEMFWATQGVIANRKTGGGRKGKNFSNLFPRMIYCHYCRGKVHYRNKGLKGGRYLVCDNASRNLGCPAVPWRYDDFEASFLAFARELNLGEITGHSANRSSFANLDKSILSVDGKIDNAKNRRDRTYELLIESENPDASLKEKYHCLDREILDLQDEKKKLLEERNKEIANIQASIDSDDKLRAAIRMLQDANSPDAFKMRSLASKAIIALIERIDISSIGHYRAPEKLQLFYKIMVEEHGYRPEQISPYMQNPSPKDYKKHRGFVITFKNKKERYVGPDEDNPLEARGIFPEQLFHAGLPDNLRHWKPHLFGSEKAPPKQE